MLTLEKQRMSLEKQWDSFRCSGFSLLCRDKEKQHHSLGSMAITHQLLAVGAFPGICSVFCSPIQSQL